MNQLLSFKNFKIQLLKNLEKRLAGEGQLQCHKRKKNNMTLSAISLVKGVNIPAATIYAEELYGTYLKDGNFFGVIEMAIKLLRTKPPYGAENLDNIMKDPEKHVICEVMGLKENKELLKTIPYTPIENTDLVVTYRLLAKGGREMMTMRVDNLEFSEYQSSLDDFHKQAVKNTVQLVPFKTIVMNDTKGSEVYVLTNEYHMYGATAMIYPGVLEELAEKFQSNLFILPSSRHEVIVLPEGALSGRKDLQGTVRKGNQELTAVEDILTSSVYYYHRQKGAVELYKEKSSCSATA